MPEYLKSESVFPKLSKAKTKKLSNFNRNNENSKIRNRNPQSLDPKSMYSHNFNQLKVKIKDVSLQNKTLDRQIQTIKKEIKTLACELDSQQWDGCAKAVMQGAVSKFTETGELPSTDIGMLAVKLHNMEQQKTYQEDQKQSFVDKKQDLSSRKREIIDDKIQHFDLSQEFNSTDVNNNSSRKFSDETDVYGAF